MNQPICSKLTTPIQKNASLLSALVAALLMTTEKQLMSKCRQHAELLHIVPGLSYPSARTPLPHRISLPEHPPMSVRSNVQSLSGITGKPLGSQPANTKRAFDESLDPGGVSSNTRQRKDGFSSEKAGSEGILAARGRFEYSTALESTHYLNCSSRERCGVEAPRLPRKPAALDTGFPQLRAVRLRTTAIV